MRCNFVHEGIDRLFGVKPMPVEDLPQICTCGAALTYAPMVAFIERTGPSWDRWTGSGSIVCEEDAVVFESLNLKPDVGSP